LTLRSLGVIAEASGVVWGDTDGEPTAEEMREQEDEAGEADMTEWAVVVCGCVADQRKYLVVTVTVSI
jgi:hypothetical protein